ncbi:MAG: tRNA threonylcarbamoyladenosine dehydratase [Clostridia bacterium]|nr:tRNA threonylcarbamoyladenosine dehydratase [Clostridia bacterium]
MDETVFSRTEMLIGKDALSKLKKCRVAVFGIGGVGGYTVEALARSGVGAIDLIDSDRVSVSNINRQIIALNSTVGQYKTEAAKARILDINPECNVVCHNVFFTPDTAMSFDFSVYDYVVDAVDTVTAKKQLILSCKTAGVPIISSMGAGNKLDATRFEVADIYSTSVCPLARVMRAICRENGVESLKVVYSKETPKTPEKTEKNGGKDVPGSVAFVPSVCGLIIAGEVIKDLIK